MISQFPWYPHDIWAKSPKSQSNLIIPGIFPVEVPKAGASSTLAAPTSLSISRLVWWPMGHQWAHGGTWGTHSLKKKEWSWMMFTLEDTLRFIQELSCYKYTEQLMLNMGCFFDYPIVGVHLQECGCCWEGWTGCFMFDIWWLIWLVIFRVQSCLAWHPNTISTPAKLFVLFDFQNTSNHSSCFQWIGRLCHHLWDGETKNGKSYGIWWSSIWKHKKHLETRIAWEISSQPAETFWASTWNSALEPEHQRS